MKKRKFKQNKLWWDKTVNWLEAMGSKIHWTTLDDKQFEEQLRVKLLEEAEEVCSAKTKEAISEELADLLEVIGSFCEFRKIQLQDVEEIRKNKREERGGFQGRTFVTIAEHPIGSFGDTYCLRDPKKYPEIIDP